MAVKDAASKAAGPVSNLAKAIAKLESKTITITTIYKDVYITETRGGNSNRTYPTGIGNPQGNRQHGGKVWPWEEYLVGERGMELFVPSVPGEIIPARETQALLGAMAGIGTASLGAIPADKAARQALFRAMQNMGKPAPYTAPSNFWEWYNPPIFQAPVAGIPEAAGGAPGMTVNNYFPIQRIEDEIETRQMARLIANEVTRISAR